MSVFPKRVENAIAAGIAQFEQMRQYNTERRVSGEVSIDIGIAIHFGHLMVGMIGEPQPPPGRCHFRYGQPGRPARRVNEAVRHITADFRNG